MNVRRPPLPWAPAPALTRPLFGRARFCPPGRRQAPRGCSGGPLFSRATPLTAIRSRFFGRIAQVADRFLVVSGFSLFPSAPLFSRAFPVNWSRVSRYLIAPLPSFSRACPVISSRVSRHLVAPLPMKTASCMSCSKQVVRPIFIGAEPGTAAPLWSLGLTAFTPSGWAAHARSYQTKTFFEEVISKSDAD